MESCIILKWIWSKPHTTISILWPIFHFLGNNQYQSSSFSPKLSLTVYCVAPMYQKSPQYMHITTLLPACYMHWKIFFCSKHFATNINLIQHLLHYLSESFSESLHSFQPYCLSYSLCSASLLYRSSFTTPSASSIFYLAHCVGESTVSSTHTTPQWWDL